MALPRITPRNTPLLPASEALLTRANTTMGPAELSTKRLNQARPLPQRNLTWTTSGNVIIATTEATVPNRFGVYPPADMARLTDDFVPSPRVNPLHPSDYRRRQYAALETKDATHQNHERSKVMKQREYYRYHTAWEKAFYGAPAEREQYRKHCRESLKQQMLDRQQRVSADFRDKVTESMDTVSYDQQCRQQDRTDFNNKFEYLKKYRDANKQMMEHREEQQRLERNIENKKDREILRYNPINWSHTLK